jgi:Zn-dependent protease
LESLERFLLFAPIVLFSMVAHEYAHGYAALKQGDNTAQALGRLTWNPLKHIDPVLTVIMPAATWFLSNGSFIFGGAKPVPVNPGLYRELRRGDIIVSLAGVFVNLVLAVLLTFAVIGLGLLGRGAAALAPTLALVQLMFQFGVFFNLLLAVFNLLPIPPLDGSHVMKYLLPPAWAIRYQRLAGMGFLILLVLLTVGRPIIMFWMTPVTYLGGLSLRFVSPYLLPSPWTS